MYACVCEVRIRVYVRCVSVCVCVCMRGAYSCVCVIFVSVYVWCVLVCMCGTYKCVRMLMHVYRLCVCMLVNERAWNSNLHDIYIYTETKVLLSEYTIKCTSEPMHNSPRLFGNKLIKRKLTHSPVFPQLQSFLRPTH